MSPSEHTLGGVQYDAELQVYHKRIDNGTQGPEWAVIVILLDSSMDIVSGLLDQLELTNVMLDPRT